MASPSSNPFDFSDVLVSTTGPDGIELHATKPHAGAAAAAEQLMFNHFDNEAEDGQLHAGFTFDKTAEQLINGSTTRRPMLNSNSSAALLLSHLESSSTTTRSLKSLNYNNDLDEMPSTNGSMMINMGHHRSTSGSVDMCLTAMPSLPHKTQTAT